MEGKQRSKEEEGKPSWVPLAGDEEGNKDPHRKKYRLGIKDVAVKVYTINQESKYILVQNVPALGAQKELLERCALYGAIEEYRLLDDWETDDEFTEVYWIKYQHITDAQNAKRKLDDMPFYSKLLQVSYAPQFETLADTREKITERQRAVSAMVIPGFYNQNTEGQKFYKIPAVNLGEVNPFLMPFAPPAHVNPTAYDTLRPGQQVPAIAYEQDLRAQSREVPEPEKTNYYPTPSANKTVDMIRNKLSKSAAVNAQPADRPSATTNPQIQKRRRI